MSRSPASLAVLLLTGFAAGIALGHPLFATILAVAIGLAWATGGFAPLLAVCLLAIALASSGFPDVKAAALDERWVALGTLALWPVVSRRRPEWRLGAPAGIAVIALLGLGLASTAWSVDEWLTVQRLGTFAALLWVALVVVPGELDRHHERVSALRWIAVLSAAVGATALVFGAFDPAEARPLGSLQGVFENPNTIGLWCALLIPFAVGFRSRLAVAAAVTVPIVVVLLSDARSGLLVLILAAFALAPLALRTRVTVAVVIAASVTVIFATPAGGVLQGTGLGKFSGGSNTLVSATGARNEAWRAALDVIAMRPIEGFGFGTGDRVFAFTGTDRQFRDFLGSNPNNAYLQIVFELGLLGLLVLGCLIGLLLARALPRWKERDRRPFVLVAMLALAASLVESLLTSAGGPFSILFWFALGVAAAEDRRSPTVVARPRVLLHATSLRAENDGARTVLVHLLAELPRAWPEARWLVTVPRGSDVAPEGWGIVELGSGRSGLLRALEDLFLLPATVARLRPDVILAPSESVPYRIRGKLVVIAQNAIYHCPSVSAADAGRWRLRLQFAFYRWQAPRAYDRADGVICVSEHLAQQLILQAGLQRSKVTVVSEGADGLPLALCADEARSRRLLAVGTLAPYKRLEVALRALRRLRDDDRNAFEVVAIGDAWPGYSQALDALARDLDVTEVWRRTGALAPVDLADAYSTGFALLALSSCESFGLPVVEAMRAGLPVIVAAERWSFETAGGAAIFVDADAACLAVAIRSLENPAEWRSRSAAGRTRADALTWSATAEGVAGALRRSLSVERSS